MLKKIFAWLSEASDFTKFSLVTALMGVNWVVFNFTILYCCLSWPNALLQVAIFFFAVFVLLPIIFLWAFYKKTSKTFKSASIILALSVFIEALFLLLMTHSFNLPAIGAGITNYFLYLHLYVVGLYAVGWVILPASIVGLVAGIAGALKPKNARYKKLSFALAITNLLIVISWFLLMAIIYPIQY